MASPIAGYEIDDKDLDDAALWAVIDSAVADSISSARSTSKSRPKPMTPIPFPLASPQLKSANNNNRHGCRNDRNGEVVQNQRPCKVSRTTTTSNYTSPQLMMVKHVPRTPTTPPAAYIGGSPETKRILSVANCSSPSESGVSSEKTDVRHSLACQYPSVSLFKDYQNAAMAILEKSDYTLISGSPYIKKSGWRKISFYFNISFEIRDKTIEFDENHNVQRAEFIVRAYMQGGRFSDGWGSCERREKRFMKPNHDIPCTAETRAKNRACQDLIGIGEYRAGIRQAHG